MPKKNFFLIVLLTGFILSIPLIAMQFTDEVVWTLSDFLFAGLLLFATGLAFDTAMRKGRNTAYRAAACLALAATFLLIWINGAVGIIGNEGNPANLLYGGVLITEFFGVIIVRLRAKAMARVMFTTAAVQALVPVVAFMIWRPPVTLGVLQVFVLNAFFVALFVGSGLLFRQSGETARNSFKGK